MTGERILTGTILGFFARSFDDGLPPEPMVLASLGGSRWDLPIDMFIEAGYTKIEQGDYFRAETPTPIGRVPQSLGAILPPIARVAGEV